ncbi:potassium channel protein [Chlorobaculum thiosulfatiphilum]|uniref:Potassium channel protein n=1 Tax=Chlorobaculum thiosulfatiphilum TaxID=115852 RepID=A0A5C4S7Q5_CHLTI|nr:potassium channel protein [Chlorobaculum thiosulfatiphilum]TNJ39486.1 potassium channel protein [Chlorobaculum thiosulfatiphilum]
MTKESQQFSTLRRFWVFFVSVALLILSGAFGYMSIEHMTPLDALYMTIITVATVGFHEVHPLSDAGKIFTMVLIVSGTGLFFFTLTNVAVFLLSGEWRTHWETQRNERMLRKLNDHFIICGYGRLGGSVAEELRTKTIPFVVIDNAIDNVLRARDEGFLAIKGNAADEEVLADAGLHRAKGLIAAAGNDAENVFIVLTARNLKPNLYIVARADCDESESKLRRAGAEKVVMLYRSAGKRMANLLTEPELEAYLDELSNANNLNLRIAQYLVSDKSPLVGKSFQEVDLYNNHRINVVGYKLPGGELHTTPRPAEIIQKNGTIIVIGQGGDLEMLSKLTLGEEKKS